jgi:hypothetical protein
VICNTINIHAIFSKNQSTVLKVERLPSTHRRNYDHMSLLFFSGNESMIESDLHTF